MCAALDPRTARVSLDGHSGSMTPWRHVTHLFLLVFLSSIDLSKEACYDYFQMYKYRANLTDIVSIVRAKDPKDTMECTVERECHHGRNICHWLECFKNANYEQDIQMTSEKCKGAISQGDRIHFYHFYCLTAKSFKYIAEGCDEYDSVCELYSHTASIVFDQKTTLPRPTTTTPTTTLPPPTTTMPTTTTMPPTTTTTTVSETTTDTQSAVSGSNGKQIKQKTDINNKEYTDTLVILLKISLFFHVVVPLAVFLLMHHRWKKDRKQWLSHELNGNSPGAQLMTESKANIPLASDNVETMSLIQKLCSGDIICKVKNEHCHSVLVHSVVEEGTQH